MKQVRRPPKRKRSRGLDRQASGPVPDEKHFPSRHERIRHGIPLLLHIGSLLLSCVLVIAGQQTHSMTIDEANHLLRGVRPLQTGDFSLSYAQPPVANLISAVPVAFGTPRAYPPILQRPPEKQTTLQQMGEEP